MSDAAKPMLAPTSDIELDTGYQSPTPNSRPWRKERPHVLLAALQSFKNAFKDAWHDLMSVPRRSRPFKSAELRRIGTRCLIIVWTLSIAPYEA